MLFTFLNRKKQLDELKGEKFDLLIVGGGVTGAGIALDAVARGLKVVLVEKNDFASGTSSRSTKLIHGGLRYLKKLEFGLVKEVGSERAVVHRLAPHLVVPEKMLLPLFEGKSIGYWLASIGLWIYDFLAGVKKEECRKMLTRFQTLRKEPLIKSKRIKGGALYAEYRTDDARLTLELIKTSVQYGAQAISYLKVVNFIYSINGLVSGVNVMDQVSGESLIINSRAVINAAGPWVDELRSLDKSRTQKRLFLTKGVHIVVPYEKVPVQQSIYFEVEDGRMIFAIPRGRVTYIGTTDTPYVGDKEKVFAGYEDARYLVDATNAMFPSINLKIDDIESSWAGLRPLIFEDGKSTAELSRKDEVFESPSGLLSIAGGKLTGYRKMAERVVDLAIKKFFPQRALKICTTDTIPLVGNDFSSYKDVRNYVLSVRKKLEPRGYDFRIAHYLVQHYGKQTDHILRLLEERQDDDIITNLVLAELSFCIDHEMVVFLDDFFLRRTGKAYFDIEQVFKTKEKVADEMARILSWTPTRKESQLKALSELLFKLSHFHKSTIA